MADITTRQMRRMTASELATFTPAEGQEVFDRTNRRLTVGDGQTQGSIPYAKQAELEGEANARTAADAAEATARQQADAAEAEARASAIATEATARQQADAAEAAARQAVDQALQAALEGEEADRKLADTQLNARVDLLAEASLTDNGDGTFDLVLPDSALVEPDTTIRWRGLDLPAFSLTI